MGSDMSDDKDNSIDSMSKSEIKSQIMTFKGRFEFDFTDAYLDSLSIDKLRHILVAAMRLRG